MYLYKKSVKQYLKSRNKKIKKDAYDVLNRKVERLLDKYIEMMRHRKILTKEEILSFDVSLRPIL